jgi:uncharacterized protein (TIGR00299 family) protein
MWVHLDPVGGIAGDMFIAACVDAWPELADELLALKTGLDLPDSLGIEIIPHNDGVLTGRRFVVRESEHGHHRHVGFPELRALIERSRLPKAVQRRAVDIFARLANAEARVHGKPIEAVTFHEVGEWDSVVDVCGAALAIEALGATRWSVGSLPIGGGRVKSAHGLLPVPAPATTILLEGMVMHGDGIGGERVTPTGAAILRHLQPEYLTTTPPLRLLRCGNAFGSRQLEGVSNLLRILAFEDAPFCAQVGMVGRLETVTVVTFEIDDQTPEDLALALETLRAIAGVLDVIQVPGLGKKGRLTTHVQIITRSDRAHAVVKACLSETTTLGVRLQDVRRAVLDRSLATVHDDGVATRVKIVTRPNGRRTAKAELSDVANTTGGLARRQARRARAEAAMQEKTKARRSK